MALVDNGTLSPLLLILILSSSTSFESEKRSRNSCLGHVTIAYSFPEIGSSVFGELRFERVSVCLDVLNPTIVRQRSLQIGML